MSLDLDSIKAAQARVYAEVSVYEKGDAALGFLDSGVVDDLVTEVERLRHVLETHEAQYRRHRDDGYRLSAKHERERDEARAAIAVARQDIDDIIAFGEWGLINGVSTTKAAPWRNTYSDFPEPIYKFGSVVVYSKKALDQFYVSHWWLGLTAKQVEAKYSKVTNEDRTLYIKHRLDAYRKRLP